MGTIKKLLIVLKDKKSFFWGVVAGILFVILYLVSIQHITFSGSGFSVIVAEEAFSKIFQLRAPFQWEPIAALSLSVFELFISPMNIIIGIVLALFVMINISIAIFSYKYRNICSTNSSFPLVGVLPSMLTGFVCCAPTFVIALAPVLASFTVFFIEIQRFLIPASFFIMVLGAWWSLWRLPITDDISLM